MIGAKIIGGNGNRRELDFYPTPPEVTEALISILDIPENSLIWEPACGGGAIVDVLRHRGYRCIGTDISQGQDYLTAEMPQGIDWIITNPPFKLAEDFIKRSWNHNKPFALLLKSQYWHAAKRYKLFQECTPSHIYPLTWRPDFCGGGNPLMDMCWMVWNRKTDKCEYKPIERRL